MTHRTAAIVALVGGILMAIGSFMPWLTARTGFGTLDVAGTDGDGVFTLVAGAIAALIALVYLERPASGLARFLIIVAGLAGIVIAVVDYQAADERISSVTSEFVAASVGAGLYVLGIGSIAAIIGGAQMKTGETMPTGFRSTIPGDFNWSEEAARKSRVCVNCGKTVAADREQRCNHCGLLFATKAE